MREEAGSLIERIEGLPPALREEVERFVERLYERERTRARRVTDPRRLESLARAERSMQWVREHGERYAGQWVVLDGGRLIAHGPEARPCLEEAKRLGIEGPFLTFVEPEARGGRMGGWL